MGTAAVFQVCHVVAPSQTTQSPAEINLQDPSSADNMAIDEDGSSSQKTGSLATVVRLQKKKVPASLRLPTNGKGASDTQTPADQNDKLHISSPQRNSARAS